MTKEEEFKIIELDCPSKTYEDIGKEVNLNADQIRYIFRKNNILKKKNQFVL